MMHFLKRLVAPVLAHLPKPQHGSDDRPARDWVAVLVLGAVTMCCTVFYSTFLYYTLLHEEVHVDASQAPTTFVFNRSALMETVEEYRTRMIRFETLRSSPEDAPDPGTFTPKATSDESLEVRS